MPTFTSYTQVGAREDVSDVISMLTPHKVPFSSSIGEGTVKQKIYQWMEEALDLGADNAQVEGFEATEEALTQPALRQNTTQILSRTIKVSGTSESTETYGRASEIARQIMKKGKSLRLDLERAYVGVDQAAVLGSDGVARRTASASKLISVYQDVGISGTPAALSEVAVQGAIRKAFQNGSEGAETLMVKPTDAELIALFAGTATRQRDVTTSSKIMVKVDVYVTALGTLRVVLNREMKTDLAILYDPSMWQKVKLKGRGWFRETLAKTGDNMKIMLAGEYGLKHENYAGAVLLRYIS
jgi:hypothetical protein